MIFSSAMGRAAGMLLVVLACCEGLADGWPVLGRVQPRHAKDIASSNWSIGCETLDRDFAVYANYKSYLGPLGCKKARLQAGWAKCEKQPGVYDFAWLDQIVDDVLGQGVQPWLETSYGNTIYEGGGGTGLAGGLPTSPKALAAWDAWVSALAARYKDRVPEWEIWNEPDINKNNRPADYADFYIRTADILRRHQPAARLLAIGLAHIGSTAYVEGFLARLKERGKLALVDQITVHGYPENPDASYPQIARLREAAARFDPRITLRQGESGAPSSPTVGALSKLKTSQTVQAKWDLRRMMGDLGHDLECNVFTLMELRYSGGHMTGWNTKGLLKARPDMTVEQPKAAYAAVQHVTALFDARLARVTDFACKAGTSEKLAAFAYRTKAGQAAVTLWLSGKTPGEANATTAVDLAFGNVTFTQPVYVDLRTGEVRQIPAGSWKKDGAGSEFRSVPLYDSPVVIAEKSLVPLQIPA